MEVEKKEFYKKVGLLVIPMAIQNLINVGVSSTDVIMLSKVGEQVLAAVSLASQIQFILMLLVFGLASGAAVLTAQYWGKKDMNSIEQILGFTLFYSLMGALFFAVAAIFFPETIMRVFTTNPSVMGYGVSYLKIVGFSYVLNAFTMGYLNIIRSAEKVIVSTVIYFSSFCINILVNSVLIFGLLGFPAMGIQGAAIGTLVARGFEIIAVLFYSGKNNDGPKIYIKYIFKTQKWIKKDFFYYAFPVILNELVWGIGTTMYVAIMGHLGSQLVAANSIAQVIRQLAAVITFGLANATAILVGKMIGENKMKLAEIYAKRLMLLSLISGIAGGGLTYLTKPLIVGFLDLSAKTNEYLNGMLLIISIIIVAQAINVTAIVGVFRAGGDTKYGLFIDAVTMWPGSIVVGMIVAFVLHGNVMLVFAILMSDEILKIPLMYRRYKKRIWLKNITRDK